MDSLTRNAMNQPFFIVHMDAELPVWFVELFEFIYIDGKK